MTGRASRVRPALRGAVSATLTLAGTVLACLTAEAFMESSTGDAVARRVSEAAHRVADSLRVGVCAPAEGARP